MVICSTSDDRHKIPTMMKFESTSTPNSSPDRPKKRFRNGSSPFRGAAQSQSDGTEPVWEWGTGKDQWMPYSPLKTQVLEEAFCVQDSVILPGDGSHIADLRRFMQVNVLTGRERPIRRKLVAQDRIEQPKFDEPRRFDGRTVFLNKLPGRTESVDSISLAEIVGPVSAVESVMLSSFGTDIEWLLSHFRQGTPITLIDHPPSGTHSPSMLPLGNMWPAFQLIHPKFNRGRSGLQEHGTMHAKLIVVKWKDNNGLRIVVSSANLVEFDWHGITQCYWVTDIAAETPIDYPHPPHSTFGDDLSDFVQALVTGNELVTDWTQILSEWANRINSQIPDGVYLLPSIPGLHSGEKSHRYGQLRLRDLVTRPEEPPSAVQFQMSSIGMLQAPFVASMIESMGSSVDLFKIVWPEYSKAMGMKGKDHMFVTEKNAVAAQRYMTPLRTLETRTDLLNHSKMMAGNDWMYMGSHNMSMSAWGRIVFENKAVEIASYELGIVIVGLNGFRINHPFVKSDSPGPLSDKTWMMDAFAKQVSVGTEGLSDADKALVDPPMSLGDFLASKSRNGGKPIAVVFTDLANGVADEYISTSVLPAIEGKVETFKITVKSAHQQSYSYTAHLLSLFNTNVVPSLFILAGGSDLSHGGLRVLKSYIGVEDVLNIDPATLLSPVSGELQSTDISLSDPPTDDDQPVCDPTAAAAKYVADNDFSLLCIDVDGTIVDSNTSSVLLPHFVDFITKIDPAKVKVALVTNQGGVGLRHWMTANSFGEPETLPTQEDVEKRLNDIHTKIKAVWSGETTVFMAFRFQAKSGRWGPVPFTCKDEPRWQQDWRKPGCGMLVAAMKWAKISPFETKKVLMIGDMDVDEGAAKSANVKFQKAPFFFTDSESLS